MGSLEQLYQQVILDHARESMGRAILRGWTHPPPGEPDLRRRGDLGVTLDGQTLASVQWDGDGCSISRASLSMMTDLTQGKSAEEIGRLYRDMEVMMHSRNLGVDDEILDELGDAAALESTSQFANRVKCALLGWYALRDAMAKSGIDISHAASPPSSKGTAMSNPMAQSEPVEQRFGAPASNEAEQAPAPTRQIDGTDVVEQGSLAADNVLEALKDVIDPELGINIVDFGPRVRRRDRPRESGAPRHDADVGRLPADRRDRASGPHDPVGRDRRGADQLGVDAAVGPTASRRTAASSFARSASTSELPVFSVSPEPLGSGDTRM